MAITPTITEKTTTTALGFKDVNYSDSGLTPKERGATPYGEECQVIEDTGADSLTINSVDVEFVEIEFTLNNAELVALGTSASLGTKPAAGQYIPIRAIAYYTYDTAAYTVAGMNDIQITNGDGGDVIASVAADGLITPTADTTARMNLEGDAVITNDNLYVVAGANATDPGTAAGTLKIVMLCTRVDV